MRKGFLFILVIVLGIMLWKKDVIAQYVIQNFVFRDEVTTIEPNEYYKKDSFLTFQNTESLTIKNKNDFNDFFYTILNNGVDSISLFCDFKYKDCINDFKTYLQSSDYVDAINNYVSPFNSYENIYVSPNNFNQITIEVDHLYDDVQIAIINKIIDNFIKENISSNMSEKEKVKVFHDWIINNTKYDKDFNVNTNRETYPYHPYSAYGALVEKKAVCSGYSDAIAIYLDKIGIKNYKIATEYLNEKNEKEGHVWNYVFINNKWYHLDLTWDDPITDNKTDILIYDFFLITNEQLEKTGTIQHNFNKNLYLETKNS